MRGQASLEMLITVGMVLAFTVPVVLFLLTATSAGYEDTLKAQADASSRMLAEVINEVYGQGTGAKRRVALALPSSSVRVVVEGNEVVVETEKYRASSPIFASMSTPRTEIEVGSGLMVFEVVNVGGKVQVSLFEGAGGG